MGMLAQIRAGFVDQTIGVTMIGHAAIQAVVGEGA